MELTLQFDDELSTLSGDRGGLSDLELPCLPCLLVDLLRCLCLVPHLSQVVTEGQSGVLGITDRPAEVYHHAGDLVRHLEDALLDLSDLLDDLLLIVRHALGLVSVLCLDVGNVLFLVVRDVAII